MRGLINYENEGLLKELFFLPEKCNTLWGTEYFLLDSAAFMGKKDGGQYETVIEMLMKIREQQTPCGFFS